jgi:hypothetical protein
VAPPTVKIPNIFLEDLKKISEPHYPASFQSPVAMFNLPSKSWYLGRERNVSYHVDLPKASFHLGPGYLWLRALFHAKWTE